MTDNTAKVREHYRATDLTNKIKSVLATTVAEGETPSVVQLARLDRFHTRGILATAELASAAPALKNGMEIFIVRAHISS